MSTFHRFKTEDLDHLLAITDRQQMMMHEYSFLSDYDLKTKFTSKLQNSALHGDSISYVVRENNDVIGYIECSEDSFDSEHLGIRCFRITELIVSGTSITTIRDNAAFAVTSLVKYLKERFGSGYLFASLSNNHPYLQDVFNAYSSTGFHFIHTLLTFSQTNIGSTQSYTANTGLSDDIHIREARIEDLPYLEKIAVSSFKYSRFHMDPLLDDDKASNLLKTSVHNSLAEGLADVIFVAEYNGRPVGYYSGRKRFDAALKLTLGEATTSAVSAEARGKGVFKLLNSAMLDWFDKNTDVAEMGTYMANSAVHRTWISNNLRLVRGTHQFSRLF